MAALVSSAPLALAPSQRCCLPLITRACRAEPCRCYRVLEGHRDSVYCLAAFASGLLASGSTDRTIIIWEENHQVHVLRGHQDVVYALQSVGPNVLASAAMDATIRLWDIGSGICFQTLTGHQGVVNCLAAFSDGILFRQVTCPVRPAPWWREPSMWTTPLPPPSAASDCHVKVWCCRDGYCLRTLAVRRIALRVLGTGKCLLPTNAPLGGLAFKGAH
jgi:hypothetical protein